MSSNNDEILNDIQQLQTIEKDLFNSLENSAHMQPDSIQKIINKINDVSKMRINLYKLLNNLNGTYKNHLTNSREVLSEQNAVIKIVESELNTSKKRLALIEEEKNNKIRLIEINNYYGESYDEHTNMIKLIIYISIPIMVLTLLFKKDFISSSIYLILFVIIMIIGLILLWNKYSKIHMHDKLNYPEYNWTFDASIAPGLDPTLSTTTDPWGNLNTTCIGQACCTEGMIHDFVLNKCVPDPAVPKNVTDPTTVTESFMTDLNSAFTKHTYECKKPDIIMNSTVYPKNY